MPTRTVSISFPSAFIAHAAFESLSLETGQWHEKKAQTRAWVKDNEVRFTIVGETDAALAASSAQYEKMAQYLKKLV